MFTCRSDEQLQKTPGQKIRHNPCYLRTDETLKPLLFSLSAIIYKGDVEQGNDCGNIKPVSEIPDEKEQQCE